MLSDKLKKLRLSHGLTQKEIAEKFALSSVRYNQYENGKRTPDIELVIKFADFYNVTLDYLLDRKEINLINKNKNNLEMQSLIEKLYSADNQTRASVEQFLNFLLQQKQEDDKKKIAK